MNFSYTEEQQAIFDLAAQILSEGTPQERLLELERADGPRFDPELWAKLGEAGLVAIAVPEAYDGGGLGFLELAGVIEHIGRTTAPVPYLRDGGARRPRDRRVRERGAEEVDSARARRGQADSDGCARRAGRRDRVTERARDGAGGGWRSTA